MERIAVRTSRREELRDITAEVRQALARHGLRHGIAVIYVPHTTAAITINENADPDVPADLLRQLAGLVPQDASFRRSEGNADAHIKAVLVGASQTVIVRQGEPVLGRWQGIFLCEFDGPREREVLVRFVADDSEEEGAQQ